MKLKIFIPIVLVLISATWYLFSPLSSDKFKIQTDEALLASKKAFLENNASNSDTMKKPNILWIVVDDLGYYDTDLYGEGLVKVPNISKLATIQKEVVSIFVMIKSGCS